MLTYRRIDHEKDHRAEAVWNAEELFPAWYRDASHAWTPDLEAFREFWDRNAEIWGLFDGERLVAIVYLEQQGPRSVNIHVSILERVDEAEIVRFFRSLTAHKGEEDIIDRTAWILKRNRALVRIAEAAGYVPTGLKLDYGASHGRLLRWVQFRG